MDFIWSGNYPVGNIIISALLIAIYFGALFFVFYKVVKRTVGYVFLSISLGITFFGWFFDTWVGSLIGLMMSVCLTVICFIANIGDLRTFLSNPFKRTAAKTANFGIEKIYDCEELYATIDKAVKVLSATRTGAIITFEKSTSLKDIIKNGTPIHAPVSEELLETIFFPGTRLHDGAVIIHGNEIIAASVFFTPTTKPFAGKYGSRHRAAIGISEISDAVTVVVSEETGRISFAINGDLEICSPDNFLRSFENHMSDKN